MELVPVLGSQPAVIIIIIIIIRETYVRDYPGEPEPER